MGFASSFGLFVYDFALDVSKSITKPIPGNIIPISVDDIENNPLIFGIGKTKSEYVIATFNEDFTEVTITKNGANSDGLMKDFDMKNNVSPMRTKANTLISAKIEKGVVSIGDNAFRGCKNLADVMLPKGLKMIRNSSFNGCGALVDVNFVDTLETIDNYAFYGCNNLSTVELPASLKTIGKAAFAALVSTEEIKVDSSNKHFVSIDGVVYNTDMTNLVQYPSGKKDESYILPQTITHILPYAVSDNLYIKDVTFNEGLEKIDFNAFSSDASIKHLSFPSTLKHIGYQAFYGCVSVNDTIVIPKSVTMIDGGAFRGSGREYKVETGNLNYKILDKCLVTIDETKLVNYPALDTSVNYTVPESIKIIGEYAFGASGNLKEIVIQNKTTHIEKNAFEYMANLDSLTIPESVVNIGSSVLYQTFNVKIYGVVDSYAQSWANNNGYTFVAI